jgi:uncharacterized protein YwqG
MSISIQLAKTDKVPQIGQSYFWDAPQVPDDFDYPFVHHKGESPYPMTFIAQINCAEVSAYDDEQSLPAHGMLYFFGDIDYFLGYADNSGNGLGRWEKDAVKVIYCNTDTSALKRYNPFSDDDTIPPYPIDFGLAKATEDGHKLLGLPFDTDELMQSFGHDWQLLFQIDSDETDDFNLRFYDMGMLYFMIPKLMLKRKDFSSVECYMTSM